MLPERGLAAKYAKSVLFEEFNDIDIFIEDTADGYQKIFREIFSRVFEGQYRVNNVFPLGGRKVVLDNFELNKENLRRPTLYIVDGDLFLLVNDNVKNQKGLFVLPCYCVENILIDNQAICEILNEENHEKTKDELINEFDFQAWLESNYQYLLSIFIEYGVCFSLMPEIQTVHFPVRELVSSSNGVVDSVKVSKRIDSMKSELIQKVGIEKYQETRAQIESCIEINPNNLIRFVSGKDYLMPLLFTRFKLVSKSKISNINFKLRLSIRCNIAPVTEAKNWVACS